MSMSFGERLKQLRGKQMMTQGEVALKAGITRKTYIEFEKYNKRPKEIKKYYQLAEVLKCDAEYLLEPDDVPDEKKSLTAKEKQLLRTVYAAPFSTGALMMALPALAGVASTAAIVSGISGLIPAMGIGAAAGAVGGVAAAFTGKKEKVIEGKNNHGQESDSVNEEELGMPYEKEISEFKYEQDRMEAMARAILISKIAVNHIPFGISSAGQEQDVNNSPNLKLQITDPDINEWDIYYWFIHDDDDFETFDDGNVWLPAREMVKYFLGELLEQTSASQRKISVATNDEGLYETFLRYKGTNTFNGNLSIIMLDMNRADVTNEEYIYEIPGMKDSLDRIKFR